MEKIKFEELTWIGSRQNSRFKEWNRLTTAQGVKKQGKIVIEGLRACLTAIEQNADISDVLISSDKTGEYIFENIMKLLDGSKLGFNNIFRLHPDLLGSIADSKNPQGIIFIVHKPELKDLAEWLRAKTDPNSLEQNKSNLTKDKPIKLALFDQLADPGNVGTMIRTADAFGFSGIILSEGTVDPYSPKVLRSTMGSLFALDLLKVASYDELRDLAKQFSLPILISDLNGESLKEFTLEENSKGFILGIGNEAHGISENLKQIANNTLTIPMPGTAESLNAAIAFAIMAYELTGE